MNQLRQVELPTRHTRRRCRNEPPALADVAVVGAGLGGLMAAALLARQGARVVVFDGHYVAGGCATMYARVQGDHRWCFDVGVHYLGEAGPRQRIPALLAAAGVRIPFEPLDPEGFERVHLPGLSFKIPWTIDAYRERLVDTFPAERTGIDRYVRVLREVDEISRALRGADGRMGPGVLLRILARGRSLVRYQRATIAQLLDDCTQDPLLRALLLGQHGDYAVAPSRASAIAHLAVQAHYFRGGWYPRGGGQRMADALADAVEAAGGTICLRRAVARILVEDGRAAGVLTEQGEVVRAPIVLSNADLKRTLLELLPPDAVPARLRRRAEGFGMAAAIHLLCLGVRGDLRDRGMRPGNDWITDTTDVEALYAAIGRGEVMPRAVCATSGTVKDPETHGHAPEGSSTLELMALVPGGLAAWGVAPDAILKRQYAADEVYRARKHAVEERLLDLVERVYPGLRDDVIFRESGTPITHARFTRATDGTPYGLAAVPEQLGAGRPDVQGHLPGLWLCGASTRNGHGVVGTLHSGWRAGRLVCRALGLPEPTLPG